MKRRTIAEVVRAGIRAGQTNEQIIGAVRAEFPQASTSPASVAWYRSQMKKEAREVGDVVTATGPLKPADRTSAEWARAMKILDDKKGIARLGPLSDAIDEAAAKRRAPTYTVGGYKPTSGIEGPGFIVNLLRDGKCVAEAADYGEGAAVHWTWADRGSPLVDVVELGYDGKESVRKGTREEATFALYCRHLPQRKEEWDERPHPITMDIAVEDLVNDLLLRRQLRRLVKDKLAMVEGGKLFTLRLAPTAENLAKHKAANPGATFLNDLPEGDAVLLLRKLQK